VEAMLFSILTHSRFDNFSYLFNEYKRNEEDLRAIKSVGMLIGEVLKRMDESFIVKASSGHRYVVGCRTKLDKNGFEIGHKSSTGYDHSDQHASQEMMKK
jgi:ATP-dependent 26S proteasome regulatory subunit